MAFIPEFAGESAKSVRNERRRQEDKRRMAYRRAIEDYREAQALQAQLGDFPEWVTTHRGSLSRPQW
ncbi:hypothetical protein BN1049_01652 [Pseudomonas saudimassiliensis]|uniref:Uncharacterized protein n=1 Tax=Pseudomonas saudimassiliensis TaxID=1461581 RepID=A0A078MEI3_9PSED|nr:hypothetical protein [Pseudomonas saudimassiliensis]CEA04630.1 hypothetical protein BN1049_01652 [Pseudomonas saudimassiliensis]CEF26719.1 hypothetical protein BN1049_01652 [Pseudomonas saudimassiliensis]